MYVAVTRAGERLYLTRAASRFLYGARSFTAESRFVAESRGGKKQMTNDRLQMTNNIQDYNKPNLSSVICHLSSDKSSIFKKDGVKFVTGVSVKHPTFGKGVIISVAGAEHNKLLGVKFEEGVKMLSLVYAPLEVCDE